MASLMVDANPPAARQALGEALNLNPSYVPAHVLNAQLSLDDGKRDEAKESLGKALAVNPNSLEARSIDAAIAFLEDRKADFDAKIADILKINPRYGEVYRLAAEVSSHNYHYIEAADFPKHDDFAVRTMGLPGMIGALGVCFGQVVVFDSPKARPPGEFSWQETLWHELTHVITLQMSNNRVPRWLTEGISVWQEAQARPDWGRETTVPFAQALEQGQPLNVRKLNEGFQDPELIVLSYYQASQVVDYLVKTHGEAKLHAFVRSFGRGIDTEAALKETYGVGIDQVQTGLAAAFDRDFGPLRKALKKIDIPQTATPEQLAAMAQANPDSFVVHMRLAEARQKAGDAAGAMRALEQAAQLLPALQGKQNPHVTIAEIAIEQKNVPRAIQALDAFLKVDGNDVDSARQRAQLLEPMGDAARTAAAYLRVVDADPFDSHAQTMVGRAALQRKDAPAAGAAFRPAAGRQPAGL